MKDTVKRDLKATIKWLDANKFRIFQKGIKFMCTVRYDDESAQSVGMGESNDMMLLILEQIYNMEQIAQGVTTEQFAESIKQNYIMYKEHRDRMDNSGAVMRIDKE